MRSLSRNPNRLNEFPPYMGGDTLVYGKYIWEFAPRHRLANEHGLALLFAAAAERFPVLRIALNRLSDSLLFPECHSPERLMRQVRDEARWRHAD